MLANPLPGWCACVWRYRPTKGSLGGGGAPHIARVAIHVIAEWLFLG